MSEPRPGYRSTLTLEMVDPDNMKMSDLVVNWYGNDSPEDCAIHNMVQTSIVEAVNNCAVEWGKWKADRDGAKPATLKT